MAAEWFETAFGMLILSFIVYGFWIAYARRHSRTRRVDWAALVFSVWAFVLLSARWWSGIDTTNGKPLELLLYSVMFFVVFLLSARRKARRFWRRFRGRTKTGDV